MAEHLELGRINTTGQSARQRDAAPQAEAIAAQHRSPPSDQERREMEGWRAIRRVAAARTLRRD